MPARRARPKGTGTHLAGLTQLYCGPNKRVSVPQHASKLFFRCSNFRPSLRGALGGGGGRAGRGWHGHKPGPPRCGKVRLRCPPPPSHPMRRPGLPEPGLGRQGSYVSHPAGRSWTGPGQTAGFSAGSRVLWARVSTSPARASPGPSDRRRSGATPCTAVSPLHRAPPGRERNQTDPRAIPRRRMQPRLWAQPE
jgi:hypothetical protein